MKAVGMALELRPGCYAEYKKRHDEVWTDLSDLLSQAGLSNYSIYRHGLTLFAYVEVENPAALLALAGEELMQKWWRYMEPLMECNEDSSPKITMLEEVFHMD